MKERSKSKTLVLGLVALLVLSSSAVYIYLDQLGKSLEMDDTVVSEGLLEEERKVDPTTVKVTGLISQLDESMIQRYLEKLTSFGPHPTARRFGYWLSNRPIIGRFFDLPIEKVAKYLYKEFESFGLEVRYQHWKQDATLANLRVPTWDFGWFVGNNVLATLPGTDKSSDDIYVIVAHYDTVMVSPGANDDSTGVAAILAAAKLMSKCSFNHTVHFLCVDGEEQWLLGSNAYAEEAAKNNDNVVATLCIDMIGNRGPGQRDDEVLVAGSGESSWINNLVAEVNERYLDYLNFTIIPDVPENHGSDHRSFLDEGFHAVFFAEAVDDVEWHTSSDTLEKMDVAYATKVSKLTLATLVELADGAKYE